MRNYIFLCLLMVALLICGAVPQKIYADNQPDTNPEKWLTEEEVAFVASFRSRASETRAEISNIRGLMGKPKVLDNAWYANIAHSTSFGCGLPSAPQSMQDIPDMWQEFVCVRLLAIGAIMVLPKPHETGDFAAIWTWLDHVNGLVEEAEAGIIIVEMTLNKRIAKLAEGRAQTAEVAGWLFGMDSCFIATAAYGTPAAVEIDVLRQFRDEFLKANAAGRVFVCFYYQVSPPVAQFISEHEVLRTVVRKGFVAPMVKAVDLTRSWWAE